MPGILDDYLNSSSSNHDDHDTTTANTTLNGQQILEENSNFQPTHEEILEYAETVLELKNNETETLLWIAEEGIKAPLPDGWKPVTTDKGDLYYFNFNTGESMWEHPCDEHYKNLVKSERKKLSRRGSGRGSGRSSASSRSPSREYKDKDKEKEPTASANKLKPLKLKSSKSKLDENEERDFIRSLRSSTEVEEKIEPPVERKPLSKKLSNVDFDDLLKSTTSESEGEKSDSDSEFDILPKKSIGAKNSTTKNSTATTKKVGLLSKNSQNEPKRSNSVLRNSQDGKRSSLKNSLPERKKSVTFEDNPINNIVSDSFDDFDSKSHTPIQGQNPRSSSKNGDKDDVDVDDSVDFEKFGQGIDDSDQSSDTISLSEKEPVKEAEVKPKVVASNRQEHQSIITLQDKTAEAQAKIDQEFEQIRLKLQSEKEQKINALKTQIQLEQDREHQLSTLKLKEAENRVAEIEKELSKQRFDLAKSKEDKINNEKLKVSEEVDRAVEEFRGEVEMEKEEKLEKVKEELEKDYELKEKDAEDDFKVSWGIIFLNKKIGKKIFRKKFLCEKKTPLPHAQTKTTPPQIRKQTPRPRTRNLTSLHRKSQQTKRIQPKKSRHPQQSKRRFRSPTISSTKKS